jgi:hypothetical protein
MRTTRLARSVSRLIRRQGDLAVGQSLGDLWDYRRRRGCVLPADIEMSDGTHQRAADAQHPNAVLFECRGELACGS